MVAGERFNTITHLAGSLLALIGSAIAIALATQHGDRTRVIAIAIYGAMLLVLYLSSTFYHLHGHARPILRVFDRCAIYLLIAGTYTPFTLVTLRGAWGWSLFAAVWTLAILGVAKDIFLPGRFRIASVVLYILMGWMMVLALGPLRLALPATAILLIAAGGIIYTFGVVFFALSKHVIHMHGIWHLCVIGGSACHYFAVVRYVAMR